MNNGLKRQKSEESVTDIHNKYSAIELDPSEPLPEISTEAAQKYSKKIKRFVDNMKNETNMRMFLEGNPPDLNWYNFKFQPPAPFSLKIHHAPVKSQAVQKSDPRNTTRRLARIRHVRSISPEPLPRLSLSAVRPLM